MVAAKRFTGYLVLTCCALIFIYPFILAIATSFKPRPEVTNHPVLPFPLEPDSRAWDLVFGHSNFLLWTANSVFVTVVATLLRLLICSMAGYALARLRWRGRGFIFAGVLAVLAVPPIVLTIPRFLVLKELDLLNTYWGLMLPLGVDAVGIFIMKQFFEHLPRELEEAAAIDGASLFQTYWRIVLPLARPGLLTLAILSFQGTWNEFLLPLIAVRGNPDLWTLPFGLSTVGRGGFGGQSYDYPVMLAGAMLTIVPVAIVFLILQRYFVRGVAEAAVKG
jgi:multiple sugar transport system permease protein